jgi:hypothetical protein
VPEGVVVALEAVEVEQDQGQRRPLGVQASRGEVDLHPPLVAEPGQVIRPHLLQ